jgi:hypothetical protein
MARKQRKKMPRKKSEAELAWLKIKGKYPNCTGSYPECPPEIKDKTNPPDECHLCPVYLERRR